MSERMVPLIQQYNPWVYLEMVSYAPQGPTLESLDTLQNLETSTGWNKLSVTDQSGMWDMGRAKTMSVTENTCFGRVFWWHCDVNKQEGGTKPTDCKPSGNTTSKSGNVEWQEKELPLVVYKVQTMHWYIYRIRQSQIQTTWHLNNTLWSHYE